MCGGVSGKDPKSKHVVSTLVCQEGKESETERKREESLQSVHMRVRDKTREKGERQEKGRDMRERQVRDMKSDK